jgi:hypothetical protein
MARGRRFLGQLVFVVAVMAAAFVGGKLGLISTPDARASHDFSDVPDDAFYHDFVQFLVDNGITAGCGPDLFCGAQAVTRGQMAVFLKKLSDLIDHRVSALMAAAAEHDHGDLYYTKAQIDQKTMFAVVNANGSLRRGTAGTTSALFTGGTLPGDYAVSFPRSVAECAWVASVTATEDGLNPDRGQVGVTVLLPSSPNTVYIQGQNSAGAETEVPFTLIVSCP